MNIIKSCLMAVFILVAGIYCDCASKNHVEFSGKCLEFNTALRSYENASSDCISRGYRLLSIHNYNEDYYLSYVTLDDFSHLGVDYYWIGFTQTPSGFKWNDSTSVDYKNLCVNYTYNNFAKNIEYGSACWKDLQADQQLPYICAYDVIGATTDLDFTTTIPGSTSRTVNCDSNDILLDNRCYSFIKEKLNRSDATRKCQQSGKTLAVFDSFSQINFITSYSQSQFGITYGHFWIGFQRDKQSTSYYWQDGSSIKVTNWFSGYPHSNQYFVAQDVPNGKWKNVPESELLLSVCSGVL